MLKPRNQAPEPHDDVPLQEITRAKQGGKIVSFRGTLEESTSEEYQNSLKRLSENELRLECMRLKSENSMLLFFISERNLLPEYIESRSGK